MTKAKPQETTEVEVKKVEAPVKERPIKKGILKEDIFYLTSTGFKVTNTLIPRSSLEKVVNEELKRIENSPNSKKGTVFYLYEQENNQKYWSDGQHRYYDSKFESCLEKITSC